MGIPRGNNFFDLKYFENSQCSIGCYLSNRNERIVKGTGFLSVLTDSIRDTVYFLKQVYVVKAKTNQVNSCNLHNSEIIHESLSLSSRVYHSIYILLINTSYKI